MRKGYHAKMTSNCLYSTFPSKISPLSNRVWNLEEAAARETSLLVSWRPMNFYEDTFLINFPPLRTLTPLICQHVSEIC